MGKFARILTGIGIAIIAVAIIAGTALLIWARPGRLSDEECRVLVQKSYKSESAMEISGVKLMDFMLGDHFMRISTRTPLSEGLSDISSKLSEHFGWYEPDENFFDRFSCSHRGRIRVAGYNCERIRLAPLNYTGHSLEIWVEPEKGILLGWRRLDTTGRLVRGYRYTRVTAMTPGESVSSGSAPNLFERFREHLPRVGEWHDAEHIREIESDGMVTLPQWLPEGFKLRGGRIVHRGGPPPGRPKNPLADMPAGRLQAFRERPLRFSYYYSDGLNTITVIHLPRHRLIEEIVDPKRSRMVLESKGDEIYRIFHTAMVSGFKPSGFYLLFGDVEEEVLEHVLKSIPEKGIPIEPEFPKEIEDKIPPGAPPGSVERPGFQRRFNRDGQQNFPPRPGENRPPGPG